jgi:hypothetical protein
MRKTYLIQDARDIAISRNGKCISYEKEESQKHIKSCEGLVWQCTDGHIWKTRFANILRGLWCPHCKIYWNEEKCRYILQNIYNKKFDKNSNVIPGFVLDGYNEELKIAFEYNGKQHYEPIHFFGGIDRFIKQIDRDERLRKECKTRGIFLIEISYKHSFSDEHLANYICDYIGKEKVVIKWDSFYNSLSVVKILRKLAKNRGGELVSISYYGDRKHLRWKCNEGHEWLATPRTIKRGCWCPVCATVASYTINDAKKLALSRNGECLSTVYVNKRSRLKWRCYKGHEWEAAFSHVLNSGTWCPYCAGKRKHSLEEMNKLAESRGGRCVSDKYTNSNTSLEWECGQNHRWKACYTSISRGSWCPECAGRLPITIKDMKILALKHGGECLSSEYKDMRTKLLWRCHDGHEWYAVPNNIKNGRWCRRCHIIRRFGYECGMIKCSYCNKEFKRYKKKKFCSPKCRSDSRKNRRQCSICNKECIRAYQKICSNECRSIFRLKEVDEFAITKGGHCLSSIYTDVYSKMLWQCKRGHQWRASYKSVTDGRWCRKCYIIERFGEKNKNNEMRD